MFSRRKTNENESDNLLAPDLHPPPPGTSSADVLNGGGVVYCCAQPSFVGAPTFEWCSLTSEPARNSCRRVVQKIFARIETSSFGERRQYVNDSGNVQLLSIVGVDRCIFIVGCMKKDYIEDPTSGSSVGVEMDRLLVAMQRAFAQYIARSIKSYREGNNNTNNQKKNNRNNNDDDDADDGNSYGIDQDSLVSFDDAVQTAIDDASNRIADVIYNAASSSLASVGAGGNTAGNSYNNGSFVRRLLGRSVGAAAANSTNTNNKSSVISNQATHHYHHESVAASYLSGATGADDFGAGRRASSIRRSILGRQHHDNDDSDNDDDDANGNHKCCSTRMKFIICFIIVFIAAVVIFILLFACERRDTNDFQLHCGSK